MTAFIVYHTVRKRDMVMNNAEIQSTDTIVAQATPPGRGGVGILRVSGPQAAQVAQIVLGKLPKARYADYLPFRDETGKVLDQGIAIFFLARTPLPVRMCWNSRDTAGRLSSIYC